MIIKHKKITTESIKFSVEIEDKEVGRVYLYLIYNDLHKEPFGLMEDLFIDAEYRGKGVGTELISRLITEAKQNNCYKVIGCSRHSNPKVHSLYKKLGFENWGLEFRINL